MCRSSTTGRQCRVKGGVGGGPWEDSGRQCVAGEGGDGVALLCCAVRGEAERLGCVLC